jgi:hypothetical protein
MSFLEIDSHAKPTPAQGAMRIKRNLAHTFQHIESVLAVVRHVVKRHGRVEIESALGGDRDEVVAIYAALKDFVQKHKPDVTIPDIS